MKYGLKILLFSLCALLLAACSSNAVYTEESFSEDSPFKLRVDGDVAMACESARRALLGQGYLIETANSDVVKGRKSYKNPDKANTFIEMNVVCLPEATGSTLFANGVLSTYDLKKSSSSASVGLSALGSISLPIGQSADSLVKVGEETIDDREFYRRFFTAVDGILDQMLAGKVDPTPPAAPETSAPAPEPVSGPMAPAPTPVPAEPVPLQTAPATTLEPAPSQVAPPMVSEPVPAPTSTPTIVPEPLPEQAAPAPPEPVLAPDAPAITPEHTPVLEAPPVVLEPEASAAPTAPVTESVQAPGPEEAPAPEAPAPAPAPSSPLIGPI